MLSACTLTYDFSRRDFLKRVKVRVRLCCDLRHESWYQRTKSSWATKSYVHLSSHRVPACDRRTDGRCGLYLVTPDIAERDKNRRRPTDVENFVYFSLSVTSVFFTVTYFISFSSSCLLFFCPLF